MMKHKALHQIVAILLLVFAMADIASSEPCNDELNGLNEVCVSASNVSSFQILSNDLQSDIKFIASQTSDQKSTSEHPHCVECFCCCPHILPALMVKTEKPATTISPSIPFTFFLPSSPPKDAFHPPRSA